MAITRTNAKVASICGLTEIIRIGTSILWGAKTGNIFMVCLGAIWFQQPVTALESQLSSLPSTSSRKSLAKLFTQRKELLKELLLRL